MALSREALFQKGSHNGPEHPRLRRWRELKAQSGMQAEVEIYRPWDGLTFAPARIFVTFRPPAQQAFQDEVMWEDELNEGLVALGLKAKDVDTEIVRYALSIRSALEPLSMRFGQDFVRSVLVTNLAASDVAAHPELSAVLQKVHVYEPNDGPARQQIGEDVDALLQKKASELVQLGYAEDQAFDILARALAQYLSEIFHLKAREHLFGNR